MAEPKYAFLMVDYETPEFIKDIHDKLSDDDLYIDEGKWSFGKELKTHATLAPCLDNDIDIEELKKLLKPLKEYSVVLTNISVFEGKDKNYEVLKSDAYGLELFSTHDKIAEKFPLHTEYTDYHPHVTIAYVKTGVADKYKKDIISPLVMLKPKQFHFSYYDENGNEQSKTFK